MAKAKKTTKTKKATKSFSLGVKGGKYQAVGGAKLKDKDIKSEREKSIGCLLYTSPSPRDYAASRMPSSA